MSKYAINYNDTVNLIEATPEVFAVRNDIFEVPDNVKSGWSINTGGDILQPAIYKMVYDSNGNKTDQTELVSAETIISI